MAMRTIAFRITALLLVLAVTVPAVSVTPVSAATSTGIFENDFLESFRLVRIDLSRDGGTTWETIVPYALDDGSYEWKVTDPVSTESRIRVSSLYTTPTTPKFHWVKSDGRWRLEMLQLTLESPNGNETLTVGTTHTITWTWTSAGNNRYRSRYRYDVSDANFAISPPAMTVGSPNGGENWKIGTWRTITWTSEGVTGMVMIGLSRDGGRTWETIHAYIANDGKYTWKVTGPATGGARIAVVSRTNQAVFDVSDANFTISQ